MRRALVLLIPVAVVGVAGTAVAVATRESDPAFLFRQEHPASVEPAQLEALLRKAPDPLPSAHRAPAVTAHCVPGNSGQQRNPWTCRVRYQSGHRIEYHILVRPDGSYHGSDRTGVFGTNGCCLAGASPSD